MNNLLGFLLFSFTINAALIVPFIDLLYSLKFQRPGRGTSDFMGKLNSVYNKLHHKKVGTPVGGGLLIIVATTVLFTGVIGMLRLVGADIASVTTIVRRSMLYSQPLSFLDSWVSTTTSSSFLASKPI